MWSPSRKRTHKFDHERARELRRRGLAVPAIAAELGVGLTSISRVVRGVLSDEEILALRALARRANMGRLWANPEFRAAALEAGRKNARSRAYVPEGQHTVYARLFRKGVPPAEIRAYFAGLAQ